MPSPYRAAGPVEPDLSARCTGDVVGCTAPGPRVPATVGCALAPRSALLSPRFAKALSVAATALLLVASASLSAITYAAVRAEVRHGARGLPPSALLGDTHVVDALWRREERLAADGYDTTLVRATLPRAEVAGWMEGGYLRVHPDARAGGLRVVDVGGRAGAALSAVQKGDLVTRINGWSLESPEDGARALADVGAARAVVAEVWRAGRRIALRIDWQG